MSTTINPSLTSPTVRELRQVAFEALIALHKADPALVHELAGMLEHWVAVHAVVAGRTPCAACEVKSSTAALLHAVAAVRELVTSATVPAPDA